MSPFTYFLLLIYVPEIKGPRRVACAHDANKLPDGFDTLTYWGEHAEFFLSLLPEWDQCPGSVLLDVQQIDSILTIEAS